MSCKPTYKGVRYNSLSDVKEQIRKDYSADNVMRQKFQQLQDLLNSDEFKKKVNRLISSFQGKPRHTEKEVEEMFNNNPELADKVYEVLGFKSKPDVILPIGTSGSGKSTFIKSLPQENLVVIEPDAMRVEFTGNINDKSKDKEIYEEAAKRAITAIKQGKQVVFDTTNLTKEKRLPFIEAIKKAIPTANIQYKLMELNPELAKQRIKADIAAGKNRANVPDSTIDRHAASYKQMLEDIKNEPISNFEITPQQKQQAQLVYSQYLNTTNNPTIQGFKNFVQGKQFQKLTAEEKAKTIEQVTKEHRSIVALKDLAAKLAYRIGATVKFENRTDADWKGYNQGMTSVLNEAYMTPDTPFHEILAHPIIRAIKNRNIKNLTIEEQEDKWGLLTSSGNPGIVYTILEDGKGSKETFDTKIEAENYIQSLKNNNILYQSLLKELETGRGKEVFEQVKRDYNIKKQATEKNNDYEYEGYIYTQRGSNFSRYNKSTGVFEETTEEKHLEALNYYYDTNKVRYTLEEQQEEAIVTLLGMMAADKLDAKKDATLISKLKELWKQISDFVKSLLRQDGIKIDELPITTTLNDLAEIMGYGNNKIILPGYKVEYSTPLGNKYDTLEEVNNELKGLADADVEVDLSGVKINYKKITDSNELPKQFSVLINDEPYSYSYEDNQWNLYYHIGGKQLEKSNVKIDEVIQDYNNYNLNSNINNFIEKNKQYEQSKEIIEEWKKVNNIQYNPEEVYSRGQEFVSVVGAYSNFDVNIMMQNLLQHIEDNEKAGGEFTISAFTKPVDKQIDHLEGGGGKIKFKIYPQSQDIKWASNTDVYSGSVWDASEKVSKDKKSELLGVSYTKYPSVQNVNAVQPNLASIIDNLAYHHNELGISLTGSNFRLEYDEDVPYSTKKLINSINSILDQKYGKLVKPEIKKIEQGIQPTQTNETLKESIESIKNKLINQFDESENITGNIQQNDNNKWVLLNEKYDVISPEFDSKEEVIKYINENKLNKKEYTEQALINTKIAKLKEVAKKYPRSLITSKVVPINPNMVDNSERQYSKVGTQERLNQIQDIFNENPKLASIGTPEQYSQYLEQNPNGNVEGFNNWVNSKDNQSELFANYIARISLGIIRNPITGEFENNTTEDVLNKETLDYSSPEITEGFNQWSEKMSQMVAKENVEKSNVAQPETITEIEEPEDTVSKPFKNILDRLSKRFGIEYEYDTTINTLGKFRNGKVVINPLKAKADTPFHEFAHPFVIALKNKNRALYDNLVKEIKREGRILYLVSQEYTDYSPEEQIDEAIVTAIGYYASKSINPNTGSRLISAIREFIRWITAELKAIFNKKDLQVEEMPADLTIKQIADYFVFGRGSIDLSNIEGEYVQRPYNERLREWQYTGGIYYADSYERAMDKYRELVDFYGVGVSRPYKVREGLYSIRVNKPKPDRIEVPQPKPENMYYGESPVSRRDRLLSEKALRENRIDSDLDSRIDIIDAIQEENLREGLKLHQNEETNEYRTASGKVYQRLTDWIFKNFSYALNSKERINRLVDNLFERRKSEIVNGKLKINIDGKINKDQWPEMTAEEYKEFLNRNNETSRVRGNIAHLLFKRLFASEPERREIDAQILEMSMEKPGQNKIDISDYKYIEKRKEEIFEMMKCNYFDKDIPENERDHVASEISFFNKKLGLATTIDLLIRHSNGDYTMADIKSGPGFYMDNTSIFLKNGEWVMGSQIPDTKENRAKLELAWRVLALKDKFPHITFRNIILTHVGLDKKSDEKGAGEETAIEDLVHITPVSLTLFLDLIELYMLDPKNGMTEIHKDFKSRGLFDPKNYGGDDTSPVPEEDKKLTRQEKIDKYKKILQGLKYQRDIYVKDPVRIAKIDKVIGEVYDKLKELYEYKGLDYNYDEHDISDFKKYLGVMQYDISDSVVQTYSKATQESLLDERRQTEEDRRLLEEKLRPVIREYNERVPIHKRITEHNLIKYFQNPKYSELFDFMLNYVDDGKKVGYYRPTTRQYRPGPGQPLKTMTQAQWEFNKFFYESMDERYIEVVSTPLPNGVKMYNILKIASELPEDFLPRTPLGGAEIRERYGIFSKEYLEYMKGQLKGLYMERRHIYHGGKYTVPVKYLGNSMIVESGLYSMNMYDAYMAFMENLNHKKYYDPMITWGNVIADYLAAGKTASGAQKKNLAELMRKTIKNRMLRDIYEDENQRKWVIQNVEPNETGEGVKVTQEYISARSITKNIKGLFSIAVMGGFQIIRPMYNAVLLIYLNTKDAIKGELAKIWMDDDPNSNGIKYTDIDFNMKDSLLAVKQYFDDIVGGFWLNKKDTKTRLMAREFGLMNENLDYSVRRNIGMVTKNKFASITSTFLTYRISEDFGIYVNFLAQMNHIKTTKDGKTISMYDAYEVIDGRLVYTGDKRGVYITKSGDKEDLYGLTPEEVLKMKRVYQRIQGGYKEEEKLFIEDTVLGMIVMQFRRYMPAILNNAFSGRYRDRSLGAWVQRIEGGEFDKKDGETVLEWQERIYEGRLTLFMNFIITGAKLFVNRFGLIGKNRIKQHYRWKQLSPEQKQQLLDVLIVGATVLSYGMLSGIGDDEEEKTPMRLRTDRLVYQDITQGLNPGDLLQGVKSTGASVSQLLQFFSAFDQFMRKGVIQGERTREGRMPGFAVMRKSIPFLSTFAELDKYYKEDIKDTKFGKMFLGYNK